MKTIPRILALAAAASLALCILRLGASPAQTSAFHGAPVSAKTTANPYSGPPDAGASLFSADCAKCHGPNGEGSGNVPALAAGPSQSVADGELFWYITKGDVDNGMPSWKSLPENERWEIVKYIRVLGGAKPGSPRVRMMALEAASAGADAPPPPSPFTDYRFEEPGKIHRITVADLPAPFTTSSSGNGPTVVPKPENAWPKVPAGFKVEQFATGLAAPRLMRAAPNGDVFLAETRGGDVRIYRGIAGDGNPAQNQIFASGLHQPFGSIFIPPVRTRNGSMWAIRMQ